MIIFQSELINLPEQGLEDQQIKFEPKKWSTIHPT